MIRVLTDECVSQKVLIAIRGWNDEHPEYAVDVVAVGEPPDLPKGSEDPDILVWAERNGRVVLTVDYGTMPGHLADHLSAGRHSPGLICIRRASRIAAVVRDLAAVVYAGRPEDFADSVSYVPL